MKFGQQGVNPSLRLVSADERHLAAIGILEAAAKLGPPSDVDRHLVCVKSVVKTQETALDDGRAVVRSQRKQRLLNLYDLRRHASSVRRGLPSGDDRVGASQ